MLAYWQSHFVSFHSWKLEQFPLKLKYPSRFDQYLSCIIRGWLYHKNLIHHHDNNHSYSMTTWNCVICFKCLECGYILSLFSKPISTNLHKSVSYTKIIYHFLVFNTTISKYLLITHLSSISILFELCYNYPLFHIDIVEKIISCSFAKM